MKNSLSYGSTPEEIMGGCNAFKSEVAALVLADST